MPGLSVNGGDTLDGWAHVRQSIQVILRTPIGSRVMNRTFGSRLPELIDAPSNDRSMIAVYGAVADALDRWEPRFQLTQCWIDDQDDGEFSAGRVSINVEGIYMPRGHLGDRATGAVAVGAVAVLLG